MLQSCEQRLPCGCSVVFALNGTVCISHDIKYCNAHSGADLARVREDLRNVEAERDQIVSLMRAERDTLAAENRVMWEAIKKALECNRKKTGHDAICPLCHSDLDVGCIEGCPVNGKY